MIFLLLPLVLFYSGLTVFILTRDPHSIRARTVALYSGLSALAACTSLALALARTPAEAEGLATLDMLLSTIWLPLSIPLVCVGLFHEPWLRRRAVLGGAVALTLLVGLLGLLGRAPLITHDGAIFSYADLPPLSVGVTLLGWLAGLGLLGLVALRRAGSARRHAGLLLGMLLVGGLFSLAPVRDAELQVVLSNLLFIPLAVGMLVLIVRAGLITAVRSASELVVSGMDEAVVVADQDGLVIWLNDAAIGLLQTRRALALRRPLAELIARSYPGGTTPALAELVARGLAAPQGLSEPLPLLLGDAPLMYQISLVPLADDQGVPSGTLLRLRDIHAFHTREQQLSAQNRALETAHRQIESALAEQRRLGALVRKLSVPVLPISATVLVAPLVGELDAQRLHDLSEELLAGIGLHRARVALLDITGVPVIDTQIAHGLLQIVQTGRLLGTRVMLVGIRPEIAQTLVGLGINLGEMSTFATLQAGLSRALEV